MHFLCTLSPVERGGTAASDSSHIDVYTQFEFKLWLACCYIIMVFSFIYSLRICFCFSHQDDSSGSLASISALSLLNTGVWNLMFFSSCIQCHAWDNVVLIKNRTNITFSQQHEYFMALTINSLDTISKKVSHVNLTNNLVIQYYCLLTQCMFLNSRR